MGVDVTRAAGTPSVTRDDPVAAIQCRVIERSRGWVPLNLRELWRYRELLYFLAWRDIKVRYKQTALGASWAILQPLFTMIIFSIVFGHFARIPSDGVPYPLFSFCALLPWTFFSYALTQSSNSLVENANLISKVHFPRLVIPISATIAGIVDSAIALVILLGMMLYYHVVPGLALLTVPLFLILALVAALGVGVWMSALNVRYRDVRYTIPFLTQIWLYATPIVYPISLIHGSARLLLSVNPMTAVVEGFRWALLGSGRLDAASISISGLASLTIMVSGLFYFRRMEQHFADLV